jgi:hypothetical protein
MSALHQQALMRQIIRTHGVERLLDGAGDARRRTQDLELVAVIRDESDVFGGLFVSHGSGGTAVRADEAVISQPWKVGDVRDAGVAWREVPR